MGAGENKSSVIVLAPELAISGDGVEAFGDERYFEECPLAHVGEDTNKQLIGQGRDDVARWWRWREGVGDAKALIWSSVARAALLAAFALRRRTVIIRQPPFGARHGGIKGSLKRGYVGYLRCYEPVANRGWKRTTGLSGCS